MTLSWYALGTAANPLPAAFCGEGTVLEIKLSVQRSLSTRERTIFMGIPSK